MMRLSKKSLKAAVAAVLSAAVLCSASLPAFAAETAGQETDQLKIAVLSDTHYLSPAWMCMWFPATTMCAIPTP